MSEAQRAYRRGLAMYCITREPAPVTAADLAISMQAIAQAEGHARNLWGWLDGVQVGGVLRTLAGQGAVRIHGYARDSGAGRDVPRWQAVVDERTSLPAPPETAAQHRDLQHTVDGIRTAANARAAVAGHDEFTEALRALAAHQAEFIARFIATTQAPEVANDD